LVAFHCKVVAVPLATLVFLATRVTAGFAVVPVSTVVVLPVATVVVLPVAGFEVCVSADDESWQAASAANAAQPSAQPKRRKTLAEPNARRTLLD
jgi:arylamine N-acetyltransferase